MRENQKIIAFIKGIQAEIGKEKFSYPSNKPEPEMFEAIRDFAVEDVRAALDTDDKTVRDERLKPVYEKVHEHFDEIYPEQAAKIDECMYLVQKYVVRRWLLDEHKRVDGRGMDEIRPLAAEVGILPRVHGSGMFTRGQTQVLTVATLGSTRDNQLLDGIDEEETKRYIHHYNFPSYSVGETKPSRGPGRREIGHGALAERALLPVIPSVEEFPYNDPPRFRGALLERLHLAGLGLRLHAGADGRRRADQGAGRRHLLRPHHRGRALDDDGRHPGP